MMRHLPVLFALLSSPLASGADEERFGIGARVEWTSSRVIGSPDPPLPYRVEMAYPRVEWKRPLYAIAEPGTDRVIVVEQGGEAETPSLGRIIVDDPASETTDVFFRVEDLVYGLTFHPRYGENRWVYLFTNGPTGERSRRNRILRFTVDPGASPRCAPDSEKLIIEWPSAGHDGGDLLFGSDGMLYISAGDGTSDSDTDVTGQDITNLLGGVLRIDVGRVSADRQYSIPADNPFLGIAGARGELWAFGLRNPWRMSIDRESGQIWVGNNGQDLWETAHLLRRGDNYGWSVYEGNHPFYLQRRLGPAPFVPPTIEHHHREARSLTGGVVYRGERLPGLAGAYVYGDYATGRIWGARHDGEKLTWHREVADTVLQIAAFAESPRGELLVVDHGGGVYRMAPAPARASPGEFPRRLADTGLFESALEHRPAPGVIPYSVIAPAWADGASARRFLAIPGNGKLRLDARESAAFPERSVLVETLSVGAHRVETRILTFQEGEWSGYSYVWREDETDADLAPSEGQGVELADDREWRVPSRAECMSCHSRAAGFVLGVTRRQLARDHDYAGVVASQLGTLAHIGLLEGESERGSAALADPYDPARDLERRARTYLDVNCAPCHVEAGGGNSQMDLRFHRRVSATRTVNHRPRHQTFGIQNAMIIAPGEPERSVLLARVSRRGPGQMPPLGTRAVDEVAVALLREWIASLEGRQKPVRDWTVEDLVPDLAKVGAERSFESGERAFRDAGCRHCHRLRGEGGGVGPDLTREGWNPSPRELLEALIEPSKTIAPEFGTTVIVTATGDVVEGRVEREDEGRIVVRTSDAFAMPVEVEKAAIVERSTSKTSTMPEDIINFLERERILDLLAYLLAGGSRDAPAFR